MSAGIMFVPWYDTDDYYQFRRMKGGAGMPSSYDEWLRTATREVTRLLACGQAVQIVNLRPDTYFQWLTNRCTADTDDERLAYLSDMCAKTGCSNRHEILASTDCRTHTQH